MTPKEFSPGLRALVVDHIDSVAQLQALLLLHSSPDRPRTAQQISAELRVSPAWVEQQLPRMARSGFVVQSGAAWSYTTDQNVRASVAELAQAYARFPDAVITLIYSKPSRALSNFADAFRLRKTEGPPDA